MLGFSLFSWKMRSLWTLDNSPKHKAISGPTNHSRIVSAEPLTVQMRESHSEASGLGLLLRMICQLGSYLSLNLPNTSEWGLSCVTFHPVCC